jgi:hypothetical protein
MSGKHDGKGGGPRENVGELLTLLRRYVIQETVAPLRAIGRSLLFGLLAAVVLGIGSVLILLAVLRVLQTETGSAFAGTWSWVPYPLTAMVGVALVAGAGFVYLRFRPKATR